MSVRRIMFALAAVMLTAGAASGDEADPGVVCATAGKAPVDQLPAVIAACSWIQRKQPTPVDQARVWRYLGIALYRSGDLPAAIANFDKTLQNHARRCLGIAAARGGERAAGKSAAGNSRLRAAVAAPAGYALEDQARRARRTARAGVERRAGPVPI